MPGTPTTRFAIPTLNGATDLARDIDTLTNTALTAIDTKMTGWSSGPLSSRPTSTGGTPGVAGRLYYATDVSRLYLDYGTGWDELRRSGAPSGGAVAISASEARTNTAYGLHTTPDRVQGIVVPANALVLVGYQALWASSVVNAGRAALFIGANQLKIQQDGVTPQPVVQEASNNGRGAAGDFVPLGSSVGGLKSGWVAGGVSSVSDVTTGMVLGPGAGATGEYLGGPIWVNKLAAGTYDFSIQTKSASGSVTLKERLLQVLVVAP